MSLFRNMAWFIKGMREYTKSGFEAAKIQFNDADVTIDTARGKIVMITGANSGIGYQMALKLASLQAEVHLVCRNQERGQSALDQIKSSCPNNDRIFLHLADMSDLSNVADFGKKFSSKHDRLDVLILNAGAMVNTFQLDPKLNLELNFVTNTLGTYVMGESLRPLLARTPNSRVIVVSSGGMLVKKLDHADPSNTQHWQTHPNKFDGTMVYAQNKRQQVVMTEEWARMYPTIRFFSMHPGWSSTPGVETAMPSFHESMKNKLRTAEQGADTAIWLAVCPNLPDKSDGSFFQEMQVKSEEMVSFSAASDPSPANIDLTPASAKETTQFNVANRIQMGLPSLSALYPSIFFIRLEQFFQMGQVTEPAERYNILLDALTDDQLSKLISGHEAALLEENPYASMRAHILEYYQETDAQRLDRLVKFQWNEREAYRPQVQRLRSLAESVGADYALRFLAMSNLPSDLQLYLKSHPASMNSWESFSQYIGTGTSFLQQQQALSRAVPNEMRDRHHWRERPSPKAWTGEFPNRPRRWGPTDITAAPRSWCRAHRFQGPNARGACKGPCTYPAREDSPAKRQPQNYNPD
ncbi:Dehydrogenase/reductase SDR member 12 [Cichlidogyrus casuarinus]|uniref:Dehydrogenase/reductase SDR member 12 n=1 Tax=Cichlidogyrus casuarinus TaxID=1844966 RepID=A0ABD2Q0G6_9PLAT